MTKVNGETLVAIVDHARQGNQSVIDAEKDIERAKGAHSLAIHAQYRAFETAGKQLESSWRDGVPHSVLLRTKYELDALDPEGSLSRMGDSLPIDELIERYMLLVPGQPVIKLGGEGNGRASEVTGIVSSSPVDFKVIPRKIYHPDSATVNVSLVPSIRFTVPLQTEKGIKTPEISDYTLKYGLIGREAMEQAAQAARFKEYYDYDSCHPVDYDNRYALRTLRAEIDALYRLGMERIDTTGLDEALHEVDEQTAREYARRAATLRNRRVRHELWRYRANR